jgi:hypothetical protein
MKVKAMIFIEEFYAKGLEPKRGEVVYMLDTKQTSERISNPLFGSWTNVNSYIKIRKRGKFYGNPTTLPLSKSTGHAKNPKGSHYNKLFQCNPREKWNQLGIDNCFVIREVEI